MLAIAACDTAHLDQDSARLSSAQVAQREQLQVVAKLLTPVAAYAEANDYLHSEIGLRYTEGYDEDVRFDRLFAADASGKQRVNPFTEAFYAVVQASLGKTNSDTLVDYLTSHKLKIYWPYSERWDGVTVPTVTFHPIDESALANVGYVYESSGKASATYREVVVDEEYAREGSTWIVVPCEFDDSCGGGGGGNPPPTSPTSDTTPNGSAVQVTLGEVQCSKQFDTLWSGGPDFDFIRIGADLQNGQFGFKSAKIEVRPTRGDCSERRWKNVTTIWDSNWDVSRPNQAFILYDWDHLSDAELSFDLTYADTTRGTTMTGKAKYKIHNDDPIYRNIMDRNAFLAFNRQDQGSGLRGGVAVRGWGTGVKGTLPDLRYQH